MRTPQLQPKPSRFALNQFCEDFDRPVAAHLIRDILPAGGLAVISGREKSGKTFLALNMVLSVASGDRFWQALPNRKIQDSSRDGIIVYISAEGTAGFRMRKKAHAQFRGWSSEKMKSIRFFDIQAAPNMRNQKDLSDLITEISKTGKKISAIVIDTLARTLCGNENDGKELTEYVNSCDLLSREFNTLVILVHHLGKDNEKGMRGHSSLPAAVDVEIRVERHDDVRSVSIMTAKDIAEQEGIFHFLLKPIVVGKDSEGGDVVSCHVLACEAPNEKQKNSSKGKPTNSNKKDGNGAF